MVKVVFTVFDRKIIYVIYIDVNRSSAIRDMNGVTIAQISTIKKVNLTMYHCDCRSEQRGLNRVD
jgi:hypothetical protein